MHASGFDSIAPRAKEGHIAKDWNALFLYAGGCVIMELAGNAC